MKKIAILFLFLTSLVSTNAQVKIGSPGIPNSNAVLELDGGTNKGLLFPKLDSTQMAAMITAPDGLVIYNTTNGFMYLRKNATWQKVTDETNNGGFSLPYAGTTAVLGDAFSITHTTTFGDAAYFNNTAGGSAIVSARGNVKLNQTDGNTGIGIPAGLLETPNLGKLVVRGVVGAVSAMFGDKTTGVAIENNYPGIAFNSYYSGGRKAITAGYGSLVGQDPTTGRFYISSSSASIAGAGVAMPTSDRLVILADGKIGIEGNSNPKSALSFASTTGNKIDFYYDSPTAMYGIGIAGAELQLYTNTNTAHTSVGYGSSTSFTETFRINNVGNTVITNPILENVGVEQAIYLKSSNRYNNAIKSIGTGTAAARLGIFGYSSVASSGLIEHMSISDIGYVGIGNTAPEFRLDVSGRVRIKQSGFTAGIWFDGTTLPTRSFVGTFNDDNIGLYGATAGWGLLMDVNDGAVMVGTTQKATGYLVNVGGKIMAEEVRVALRANWPDYVFSKEYQLPTLSHLENYINTNNHLPNVPSAAEVKKEGILLGDMNGKLLEKIEELSLYIIQINKKVEAQQQEINFLKASK